MINQYRKCEKQDGIKEGWGIRLLEFVVCLSVPARVREEFVGDLLEEWSSCVVPRRGKLKGLLWLCSQLLRSLLPMAHVWIRGLFLGDNAMFQKQNVPKSIKLVAAFCLLFVAINFAGVVFTIATAHEFAPVTATLGPIKVVLYIAIAVGVLNLSEGWRKFLVFISGYCVVAIPTLFSIFALSPDVFLVFAEFTGIQSWVVVEVFLAVLFAMFLWMFITLRRPDVKRAFESGQREQLAT